MVSRRLHPPALNRLYAYPHPCMLILVFQIPKEQWQLIREQMDVWAMACDAFSSGWFSLRDCQAAMLPGCAVVSKPKERQGLG